MLEKVSLKRPAGSGNDKVQIKGFVNTTGRGFDPVANEVEIAIGGPDAPELVTTIPPGSFTSNSSGTSFQYKADAPGVTKAKLQLKKGIWRFQVKASEVDASPPDERVFLRIRVGGVCVERTRSCVPNTSGESLKCKKPEV
jgi:hypothetical protein